MMIYPEGLGKRGGYRGICNIFIYTYTYTNKEEEIPPNPLKTLRKLPLDIPKSP